MTELIKGKATICVVNYKTLDFTRLCLRSIRKFTKYPCEVVVIDNDSKDESLDYLKSLEWITLIQRNTDADLSGGYSHGGGLDMALQRCNTEFFVSLHSDTFIQKELWLTELIEYFENNPQIASVGSGKVELTPQWQQFLKKITDYRTFKRKLLKSPDPNDKYRYYNRTICCVYRTDILKKENLSFNIYRDKGLTSGKKLHFELVDRGYKTVDLPPAVMGKYIVHLAHATQVVNPEQFTLRNKTRRKCSRLVKKIMSSEVFKSIINDDSLDR